MNDEQRPVSADEQLRQAVERRAAAEHEYVVALHSAATTGVAGVVVVIDRKVEQLAERVDFLSARVAELQQRILELEQRLENQRNPS